MAANKRYGPMPDRDQISVVVGTIVLGFTLVRVIDLPVREIGTQALGSAIGLRLTTAVVMLIVLGALAATGTDSLLRSHPKSQAQPQAGTFILWILPVFTVLVLELGLSRLAEEQSLVWWLGLAASAGMIALVLAAEYVSLDAEHWAYDTTQVLLTGLAYTVALVLFTAIYATKERALLTATLSSAVAAAVALRLLWMHSRQLLRALLYAGIVGAGVGEAMWALGYGRAAPLAAGLVLLLLLYIGTGLSQAALEKTFGRRTVIELGIVAAIAAAIILRYVL